MTDEPTPVQRVAAVRAELVATLDEIDEKLNVPKRVRAARDRVAASIRDNPLPWAAGAAGAALVIAGAIVLAIRLRR